MAKDKQDTPSEPTDAGIWLARYFDTDLVKNGGKVALACIRCFESYLVQKKDTIPKATKDTKEGE